MLRNVASKVMWVGRATVFLVGLAVILAVVLGVASTAFGADGQPFFLGRTNVASTMSTLIKQGPGAALSLQVQSGSPPLAVNSAEKVTSLNADLVDGKSDTDFYAQGSKVADSDKLDGLDSTNFAAFKRTVVVSPTGTPQENGTALRNALASITGASATNPYLLKIEPGIYDLGGSALQMKPFVDIEGSGQDSTKITSTNGDNRAVSATSDTELRLLTVEKNIAPEDTGLNSAISVENAPSTPDPGPFRMTHVTATASGGNASGGNVSTGNFTEGMDIGRFSGSVFVALTDDTVSASALGETIGVRTFDGTFLTTNDVTVSSEDYGVGNFGFTGIRNSLISGRFLSFFQGSSGSAGIIATRLRGPTGQLNAEDEDRLKCAGVFDQNYRFYADTCPQLRFDTGSPF